MKNTIKKRMVSKEELSLSGDDLKNIMNLVSDVYINAKRRIYESEMSCYDYPSYIIIDDERIVSHIDSIISEMDESAKFILENEVKHNKTGHWYQEYCSESTYYRIRTRVYIAFIHELKK